jgi:Glycine zipper 2TM domain
MHHPSKAFPALLVLAAVVAGGCAAGKDSSTTGAPAATGTTADADAAQNDRPVSLLERVGHFFRPKSRVEEVPAGTMLAVRFVDGLSSATSEVGESVRAEVARAVSVRGVETIPGGSTLIGDVTVAHPPKIGGRAELAVTFHDLQLPSGEMVTVDTGASWTGKSEKAKDIATIAGAVVGGAILGHQVDGGDRGKVVGGIVGGAAGSAIAHETRGKPLVVPAGTVVELKLGAPVRIAVSA